MSTAGEIIERAESEYLYPGGVGRSNFDVLASNMTVNELTFNLEGIVKNKTPDHTVFEIGTEVILGKKVTGLQVTALKRGYAESSPAVHVIGDVVYVNPDYYKITQLNALKSAISMLKAQGAYRRALSSAFTYTSIKPLDMPVGAERIIAVYALNGSANAGTWEPLQKGRDWREITVFSPPKVQLRGGGYHGAALQIAYATDYDVDPFTFDTELNDIGVSSLIQLGLPMAVAGKVLQGRQIPQTLQEDIRKVLTAQGVNIPAGLALNVSEALTQGFRRAYVVSEIDRLNDLDPTTVEYVGTH